MSHTLFERIVDYSNIVRAYRQTQKGKRKFKNESVKFHRYDTLHLINIWQSLKNGTYRVGDYITFRVYEPKERKVSAPRLRDKIVQFAAHTVLQEVYMPVFIRDSYACLVGRGEHRAAKRVQHYMRKCHWMHGGGWIIKLDVAKFFYSINRDILKVILRKKIKCQRTLWLLDTIIDSSPEGDKGIPLGNVTSQDFANIYLNELDQYCKRFLGIKWYIRYMDDIIAIVHTREQARDLLTKMVEFLREKLDLEVNKKTKIFPLAQGINAYGYKIRTTHMEIREQSKRAMKRRIKAMDRKLRAGQIKLKDVQQAVNSWLGHARHSNSYNLCKRVFARYPYIKVEGEMKFGDISRCRGTGNASKKRSRATATDKPVEDRR
ncbi:MAG: reverse transcriptase/maturase family protein [Firmicutes bacterium]|nr:reverse transcriptase/maturase family protein [Bacillota bacterium]